MRMHKALEAGHPQINKWVVENCSAETGRYPDFPSAEAGGSSLILHPPPLETVAGGKDGAQKKPNGKAGTAAKPGKGAISGSDVIKVFPLLSSACLHQVCQQLNMYRVCATPADGKAAAEDLLPQEELPRACCADVAAAVQVWEERWSDREEPSERLPRHAQRRTIA